MYPSTSSYRSSSLRFRQRQRASSWHSSTNSNSNLHDSAQSKPRAVSEDYSVASSVSSLHQQEQFQQQPQRQTQQRQRQSRASRESSMMVFLETLVRCFTTRRRRRRRGAGTRKMKNNNFETVDGSANSGSDAFKTGNAVQRERPQKPYTAVPRNETEMYFMLRSKQAMSSTLASKPSIGTMATSSMTSNNSASPPRRRQTDHHPYKAKPSTATRSSSAPSTSTSRPRHIFIEHPNEDEPLLL